MRFTPKADSFVSLTCICCPLGCSLEVVLDALGSVYGVAGHGCNLGEEYAREEVLAPKRMVCATLCIKGSIEPLSVKTARPVLKESIKEVLAAIEKLELSVPVEAGTILDADIAGTGVALVATKTLTGCLATDTRSERTRTEEATGRRV